MPSDIPLGTPKMAADALTNSLPRQLLRKTTAFLLRTLLLLLAQFLLTIDAKITYLFRPDQVA